MSPEKEETPAETPEPTMADRVADLLEREGPMTRNQAAARLNVHEDDIEDDGQFEDEATPEELE